MRYHIAKGGKTYGPYSLTDLQNMAAQGNLTPEDLVWGEGTSTWVPLKQVLGAGAPPPPPQPAAPPPPAYQQAPPAYQQGPPPAYQQAPPAYQQGPPQPMYQQPPAPGAGIAPPGMHWGLLLLLAIVTCGIFVLVWMFIQASFVKKIDPKSNAMTFYGGYIGAYLLGMSISMAGAMAGSEVAGLGSLICLGGVALFIVGGFNMRASLENYYNTVEPINLRLSAVMTFFFNIIYFQYHFTRIAEWKRTGRLV